MNLIEKIGQGAPTFMQYGYIYTLSIPPQRARQKWMLVIGSVAPAMVSALHDAARTLRGTRGRPVMTMHPCYHLPIFEELLTLFPGKLDAPTRAEYWQQYGRAESFRAHSKATIDTIAIQLNDWFKTMSKIIKEADLPFEIVIPNPQELIKRNRPAIFKIEFTKSDASLSAVVNQMKNGILPSTPLPS